MGAKGKYVPQDRLFHKAKEQGYASRAAFKLVEIDQKYRLLPKGGKVLDLGAAPGSWTQVALERIGTKGLVIAIDLAALDPSLHQHPNLQIIQGDLREAETRSQCRRILDDHNGKVSSLLSDLSPKLSGIGITDHGRSIELAQQALSYAQEFLAPGGHLVIKVFPGGELENFRRELRAHFEEIRLLHLDATRASSREVYLVGLKKRSHALESDS